MIENMDIGYDMRDGAAYGRYCVAISCKDLLAKMDEIEKENM